MTKNKITKIGIRKYLNWILFLLAVVLICLVASKLYKEHQESMLSESVLSRVVGTILYEDIADTKEEFVGNQFILISYVESKEVRKLENKLKNIIIDNNIQDSFFYLDATELMLEDNYISLLNNRFNLSGDNKIKNLPALLYYNNGELVKTITSTKDKMISSNDFSKLLDDYNITVEGED